MRHFWLVLLMLDRNQTVWKELEKNTNSSGYSHRFTDTFACTEVFYEVPSEYAWMWRIRGGNKGRNRWGYLFPLSDDVHYDLDRKKYSPDNTFDFWTECVQTTELKIRKASVDSLSDTLDHQ